MHVKIINLSCWTTIASIFLIAGCNSHSGTTSNSTPNLAIAGENSSSTDATKSESSKPAAGAEANEDSKSSDNSDPDTKEIRAVYKQIGEMIDARDEGKTVDFKPLADQVVKGLNGTTDINRFELAQNFCRVLEMVQDNELAKKLYEAMDKAANSLKPEDVSLSVKDIAQSGIRRIDLLGTTPKIEGALVGGGKLDWSKYKGKVVLIDFWATWCGPCMQELPNVKKVFEKYHDQGFDVVGITLDDDKDALAAFLDKENLPWPIVFEDDPAKHGFEGAPFVHEFGVNGIPATYLVNRQGKVVSIHARGEGLADQVKTLLDEKASATPAAQ